MIADLVGTRGTSWGFGGRAVPAFVLVVTGCATAPQPTRLSQRPPRNVYRSEPQVVAVRDEPGDVISRAVQVAMLTGLSPVSVAKEDGVFKVKATWLDDWATENERASQLDAVDEIDGYGIRRAAAPAELKARARTEVEVFRTLSITAVVGEQRATVTASVVVCTRDRNRPEREACGDVQHSLVEREHHALQEIVEALRLTKEAPPRTPVRYFDVPPI